MIATPDDFSWFSRGRFPELADAYCLTYVRGLTPEELVTRLGVQVDDCSRMTLEELLRHSRTGFHQRESFGAVAVGDWVLMVEANGLLGITEEIILPLSAGTRLVSHFYLEVKSMDHFYWIEDGAVRFEFARDDGYSHWIEDGRIQLRFPPQEGSQEMPDELAETMERIDVVYPSCLDPYEGPAFLLAERLTGITMTPQLLQESIYLCGGIPRPR
ncbi:DUF6461 domain-containing protein [Nonomuraea soli]|uniref:Uncharacterized protein n=1 Tax=Nonomuraea soli TaxID=1032476 RepID=A0A7W0CGH2_9ACTN|nr:DUF6461 domain-containing protein [Nonomuraea soli]MBA2890718.1 hypothetical protein [Nonomuraea soli]